MDQNNAALDPAIGEIGKVKLQLLASQQSLVDDFPSIERTDVKQFFSANSGFFDGLFNQASQNIQARIKLFRGQRINRFNEHLPDGRFREECGSTKIGVVRWHFAPVNQAARRIPADRRNQLLERDLFPLIFRNEQLSNTVRIKVAERRDFRMKKLMRLLQKHPSAVSRLLFGTARPSVVDIA